jgi:hypothetical protein
MEPNCYRRVIIGPNADLWQSAIEVEIDAIRRNYTCDVVFRPTDRKIVDSKWVFNITHLLDGFIAKFKAQLVAKGLFQIQGWDYDETIAAMVRLNSWALLLSIVAANDFVLL